jgi:hypothetical protein
MGGRERVLDQMKSFADQHELISPVTAGHHLLVQFLQMINGIKPSMQGTIRNRTKKVSFLLAGLDVVLWIGQVGAA